MISMLPFPPTLSYLVLEGIRVVKSGRHKNPIKRGRNQTTKMAAAMASEEQMAEEGGSSHGNSFSNSPRRPHRRPRSPGSQAPIVPTKALDCLPQNNTLVALPIVAIENILSFMSYDEISQLRLVRAEVWGGPTRAARSWGGSPRRLRTRSAPRQPGSVPGDGRRGAAALAS